MIIVNGRWVDDNQNPIDEQSISKFIELGNKVKTLYGKSISYDKIKLVLELEKLNSKEEEGLCSILDRNLISKLC